MKAILFIVLSACVLSICGRSASSRLMSGGDVSPAHVSRALGYAEKRALLQRDLKKSAGPFRNKRDSKPRAAKASRFKGQSAAPRLRNSSRPTSAPIISRHSAPIPSVYLKGPSKKDSWQTHSMFSRSSSTTAVTNPRRSSSSTLAPFTPRRSSGPWPSASSGLSSSSTLAPFTPRPSSRPLALASSGPWLPASSEPKPSANPTGPSKKDLWQTHSILMSPRGNQKNSRYVSSTALFNTGIALRNFAETSGDHNDVGRLFNKFYSEHEKLTVKHYNLIRRTVKKTHPEMCNFVMPKDHRQSMPITHGVASELCRQTNSLRWGQAIAEKSHNPRDGSWPKIPKISNCVGSSDYLTMKNVLDAVPVTILTRSVTPSDNSAPMDENMVSNQVNQSIIKVQMLKERFGRYSRQLLISDFKQIRSEIDVLCPGIFKFN